MITVSELSLQLNDASFGKQVLLKLPKLNLQQMVVFAMTPFVVLVANNLPQICAGFMPPMVKVDAPGTMTQS